jgi:protein-tyrosine-phosphatase
VTDREGADEWTLEDRHQIRIAARRLKDEFAGQFSIETIERYIVDSHEQLARSATVTKWLSVLAERFARDRLRALQRLETDSVQKPSVLFLCVHNAGRSQMAAGWLRALAGDGVDVFSGGSDPGSEINAAAVAAMAEVGIDIANEFPKPWTDEIARAADVIVTMGCGDACPIFPGKRYEDWELTDPAGQPIEVVREVRDDIARRVRDLVASLDAATLT